MRLEIKKIYNYYKEVNRNNEKKEITSAIPTTLKVIKKSEYEILKQKNKPIINEEGYEEFDLSDSEDKYNFDNVFLTKNKAKNKYQRKHYDKVKKQINKELPVSCIESTQHVLECMKEKRYVKYSYSNANTSKLYYCIEIKPIDNKKIGFIEQSSIKKAVNEELKKNNITKTKIYTTQEGITIYLELNHTPINKVIPKLYQLLQCYKLSIYNDELNNINIGDGICFVSVINQSDTIHALAVVGEKINTSDRYFIERDAGTTYGIHEKFYSDSKWLMNKYSSVHQIKSENELNSKDYVALKIIYKPDL